MGRILNTKIKNGLTMKEAVALSNDKNYITKLFFNLKYPEGYKCDCEDCNSTEYDYIESRDLYQCKVCNKQSSLKSNTVFHDSKLGLDTWFLAMYILTNGRNLKVSAVDLAIQLGVSHKCALLIVHKLSLIMLDATNKHLLEGKIQLDEGFIGGKKEDTKAGKGTSKQSFLCGVSMEGGKPNYLSLILNIGNKSDANTFESLVSKIVKQESIIESDDSTSYSKMKVNYNVNNKKVSHKKNQKQNTEHLRWCDIMISNVKSSIQGTYHGIGKKYLALYFGIFTWRFNKRRNDTSYKINNLISKCMNFGKMTKMEIMKKYESNLSTESR